MDLESLPNFFPSLISAMDQYYGIDKPNEEKKVNIKVRSSPLVKQGKKLRILITTFWEYPFVGGLQNYIAMVKTGFEKLGHSVDVIAPNQFPKDERKVMYPKISEFFRQFFKERYGTCSDKILSSICDLCIYKLMIKDIDFNQYDIIHAQDRFTANIVGRLNQVYQKPMLFTPHGFMTQNRLKFQLIQKGSVEEAYFSEIDKQAARQADHVVMLCEVFRPLLKKLGADDQSMTTVYTGIDFKVYPQNEAKKDKIVITFVSRLRPRKGHKYLFEALALLKNELENVEVRIVGDGQMRSRLEEQVRNMNLKNVCFLGSRKDIPELLGQSDIFVLPTTSDTLPISIIEAMFARQAILTTNCGGIPEIIQDYYSGLIAAPADSVQLAEKLLLLLKHDKLRNVLAENAMEYANKHLTVASMVKKLEEIYLSLL